MNRTRLKLFFKSFNDSFWDECLNMNWFMSLEDARDKEERWRRDYNEFRPHSALTYLTPVEFAPRTGSETVRTKIFSLIRRRFSRDYLNVNNLG